jgi:hypothetical protein
LERRMDDCVTKMDKLTHGQEQRTKMHSTYIMDLQEVTTKECGQIHTLDREVARLYEKRRTVINQIRQELDGSFRNEMEKIRDNEMENPGQLNELERGQDTRLTVSISSMM